MNNKQNENLPSALTVFEWAVVRQSMIGPGVGVAAMTFGCTSNEIRAVVSTWNDPRGSMAVVRVADTGGLPTWRIEASYNLS